LRKLKISLVARLYLNKSAEQRKKRQNQNKKPLPRKNPKRKATTRNIKKLRVSI